MKCIYLVKQRGSSDCGIACVSMVTHTNYYTVVRMCEIHKISQPLTHRNIDRLIRLLNYIPVRSEHEVYGEVLADNIYIMAVLPTNMHSGIGHFIVLDTRYTPYKIYDPAKCKGTRYSIDNPPLIWGGLIKIQC